jgi:hypothetical protein
MTDKLTALEVDAQTGIAIERQLTADEIAEREEITARQEQELAEAWEPEVADPDVDTDTKIIPDEDEDDLGYGKPQVPTQKMKKI